jgi:hypothetical protein
MTDFDKEFQKIGGTVTLMVKVACFVYLALIALGALMLAAAIAGLIYWLA